MELTFDEKMMAARNIRVQIKCLEKEKDGLDLDIMAEILGTGETKLKQDEGTWSIQNRHTSKLNKGKLILAGVDLEIIEAATTESSSAPFLMWRGKDAEED